MLLTGGPTAWGAAGIPGRPESGGPGSAEPGTDLGVYGPPPVYGVVGLHAARSDSERDVRAARLLSGAVAATPAVRALERAGVAHTLHPYDPEHPSDQGHGEAAVAALGADPAQVFKTLVARVDGVLTVAVVPVSGTLDLKALAAAVGGRKAVMADPADAERTTGYVLGGISPLGQKKALPTVVDESALGFATVMISAGKRGLQVELPPGDLVRLTRARTAPIGR